ncbi:MAG: hypothetical protein ACE5GR_02330 [Nitrosopumilus sp.]
MGQIAKYIGLIAIVTMLAVTTVSGSIGNVEAKLIRDKHVVLDEQEPDVDLSLKQVTEPEQSSEVSVKTTKGYVPKRSDSDAITYRVIYRVQNDGTTDVKNVMISVHSDTETADGKLSGWLDARHSSITVLVKAVDPTLIDAKIVGYEV